MMANLNIIIVSYRASHIHMRRCGLLECDAISLVDKYLCIGGTCYPEDEGSSVVYLQNDMASHPKKS
jgi:hypothetical protein